MIVKMIVSIIAFLLLGPLAGGIAKCLMINQEPITDQIIDHLKEAEQAAHT